jgi:hypothetical protein
MANTYTLIASSTAGSGGASYVEFTSIPATYTDLKLVLSLRGDQTGTYASSFISFNGSTSGFTNKYIYGDGASAGSFGASNGQNADQNGATTTSNTFANTEMYIPNYTLSNSKSVSIDGVTENNATTAYAELGALLWSNSAAITSIRISPNATKNWVQYSTAYLYGISNS